MTVVKVWEPVTNNEGQFLNKEGEVIEDTSDEIYYDEQMYYLLHWGLSYDILESDRQSYTVTYTVGICQHISNGQIKSFKPTDLTWVGKEQL